MNIDITRIEMLKFQVEQLKGLMASKVSLSSELEKTQKLYLSARKIRADFESLCKTEEDYNKLQEYMQNEKEIIDLINEYAKQFGDINAELATFDESKANEVNQFLDVMSSHQTISKDIQTAEILSKKSKGDKVEVISAEGRKKMIAIELVEDYQELVSRKKACAKQMTQFYKKINNISEIKTAIAPVPMDVTVVTPIAAPVNEDIDLWETLTDEEKEKELTERLDRIKIAFTKPGMGKKRYINIEGTKMDVPVSLIGVYHTTLSELKAVKSRLANKNKPLDVQEDITPQEVSPEKAEIVSSIPEGQEIVSVTKPKTNIFKKIKAKAVLITAAVLTVVVIASALMLNNLNYKNNNTTGSTVNPTTITVTNPSNITPSQPVQTQTPAVDNNQQVPNTIIQPDAPIENIGLSVGDEVSINDRSYIYKTAIDAVNGTNHYKPYFDNDSVRVVRGISYELANGALYTLFDTDPEHVAKEKALLESGAVKKGILTSVKGNENGYEGFYNINDTKTNVMEVSNGRSK